MPASDTKRRESRPAGTPVDPAEGLARFQYRLEILDLNGRLQQELPLALKDFQAAIRATCFEAFRSGALETYAPRMDQAVIEPLFAAGNDRSPHATGFRVRLADDPARSVTRDFGIGYFGAFATRWQSQRICGGQASAEDKILYRLASYLADSRPAASPRSGIRLEPETIQIPIRTRDRSGWPAADGWDDPDPGQLPVVFPRSVLQEACDEAARAADREAGGVLLGQLCRDANSGEIFLEVTAVVSGEETIESAASSVTFTPETWDRARQLIRLRGRGESIVGWSHSHPFRLCEECPLPAPPECVNKLLFYSLDDIDVMTNAFPQPYMVGLLSAADPRLQRSLHHLPIRLYGWTQGVVAQRGLLVLDT